MELMQINLEQLHVSDHNARQGGKRSKEKDALTDLMASIQKQGLLQPLLVRAENGEYGVIAGRRRLRAIRELIKSGITATDQGAPFDPIPCAVLDDRDDIAAAEASLAENLQRLPMSAVEQYELFKRLHAQGHSLETIAERFGLSLKSVRQRMAIANLLPGIRALYEQDALGDDELRALTLATPAQQKDYLARAKAGKAPAYWELKHWILGGAQISPDVARFDVEASGLAIIEDLFGEQRYFADPAAFWEHQKAAVEQEIETFKAAGWQDVLELTDCSGFPAYEFEKTSKAQGGAVIVVYRANGAIEFHKGYTPIRRARGGRAGAQAEAGDASADRCELSPRGQDYFAAHRAAFVKQAVGQSPSVGLRLALALSLAGNSNWRVTVDELVAERAVSVASVNHAHRDFMAARAQALGLIGLDPAQRTYYRDERDTAVLFERLLALDNSQVLHILALVVAASLVTGSGLVEFLGEHLKVSAAGAWTPDETFYEVLRDKRVLHEMSAEVLGETNAAGYAKATGKVLKGALQTTLAQRDTPWVPGYLEFPFRPYVTREGIAMIQSRQSLAGPDRDEAGEDAMLDDVTDDEITDPEAP